MADKSKIVWTDATWSPITGCTCPPCPCRWCRYDRGEGTAEDRALIEANIRAHEMANRRQADRKVHP